MDNTTHAALRAIADSHRTLAQALDALLKDDPVPEVIRSETGEHNAAPGATADTGHPAPTWDPETDPPLVPPKVKGTREEQDWCSLTYLGGIYAINKRYSRGARASEIREYAVKAGYQDGRAVTAWSKGSGPTYNDADKHRWITSVGVDFWVKGLAKKLGVSLPPDLSEPWESPENPDAPTR